MSSGSEAAETNIDFKSEASVNMEGPGDTSDDDLDQDRYDTERLYQVYEEYLRPDFKGSGSNISELSESRKTDCSFDFEHKSRNLYLIDDPDFGLLESIDVLKFDLQRAQTNADRKADIVKAQKRY